MDADYTRLTLKSNCFRAISKMVKPVCIYVDDGVSDVGVASLQLAIATNLGLPTKTITAQHIIDNELEHCQMLIMPGGADLPYCAKLNGKGNQHIRQFVQCGGFYLGICAGAYYATKTIEFTGDGYQIFENRELALFNGKAVGSLPDLTNQYYYDGTAASKTFATLTFPNNTQSEFYYHGGPMFLSEVEGAETVVDCYSANRPAIVCGSYGKGKFLLSGVHFELQPEIYEQYIIRDTLHLSEYILEQSIYNQIKQMDSNYIWKKIRRLLDKVSTI
ncbi:BPL-N domain-containing protein [Glaesserella parasuis]|nr:BPL-N domain-containing protein [Glaesserella parasuis]